MASPGPNHRHQPRPSSPVPIPSPPSPLTASLSPMFTGGSAVAISAPRPDEQRPADAPRRRIFVKHRDLDFLMERSARNDIYIKSNLCLVSDRDHQDVPP